VRGARAAALGLDLCVRLRQSLRVRGLVAATRCCPACAENDECSGNESVEGESDGGSPSRPAVQGSGHVQ